MFPRLNTIFEFNHDVAERGAGLANADTPSGFYCNFCEMNLFISLRGMFLVFLRRANRATNLHLGTAFSFCAFTASVGSLPLPEIVSEFLTLLVNGTGGVSHNLLKINILTTLA